MSALDNGGPAFPTIAGHTVYSNGMTLRDWFAGQALAGMATWTPAPPPHETSIPLPHRARELKAQWAYQMADAMIAERAKIGGAA
jgi:hypothetical protein